MYYLYTLGFDSALRSTLNKDGVPIAYVYYTDARSRAESLNIRSGLSITIDERGDLHNTRDGRPIWADGKTPVPCSRSK